MEIMYILIVENLEDKFKKILDSPVRGAFKLRITS